MNVEAQIAPLAAEPGDVLAALHTASTKTGADFKYLLATAMRESKLDAHAKSKGSSATGLFQFLEQTWLGLVKRYGERHGLGAYSNAIQETDGGHYAVASHATKSAILALRKDPEVSALMAGEAANETKQSLQCTLGRDVCGGELYAAHFLGAGGARRLIELKDSDPDCAANLVFPSAARANRSIFYHTDGTAKTVSEVYDWIVDLPEPPFGAPDTKPTVAVANSKPTTQVSKSLFAMGGAMSAKQAGDSYFAASIARPAAAWTAPFSEAARQLSVLPRSPLLLSPGVLEILAALRPFARRDS